MDASLEDASPLNKKDNDVSLRLSLFFSGPHLVAF